MNKEDLAFQKMALALQASKSVEAMEDLKASAFEVLLLHPGCYSAKWATILTEQYGTEVVDAFGSDGEKVYSSLMKLWRSEYKDENSGLTRTYEVWAKSFATEEAVQMYYDLTERKIIDSQ